MIGSSPALMVTATGICLLEKDSRGKVGFLYEKIMMHSS